MNSIKNLLVVVLLMGVSYGAFQVINSPDPTFSGDVPDVEELDIQIGPRMDSMEPEEIDSAISIDGDMPTFSENPSTLPSLPPQLQSSTGERKFQSPPLASGSVPDLEPSLQGPDLIPPTASIDSAPPELTDSGSLTPGLNGNSGFQPQPQTSLQPVNPKPSSALAMGEPESGLAGETYPPNLNAYGDSTNESTADSSYSGHPVPDSMPDVAAPPFSSAGAPREPGGHSGSMVGESMGGSTIDWTSINELASAGNVRQALKALSAYYDHSLPADQKIQLLQWLDQLAGKVIYSTEHHLDQRSCVVAEGDTLESLATSWNVPAELIYNVNRTKIGDPAMLVPGTELKVIRGPFQARISVENMEMTLFLGDLYAGRFQVQLGQDHEYEYGEFVVSSKSSSGQNYKGPAGELIAAGDANNPYGKFWLGFQNTDICIHDAVLADQGDTRGSIRLSQRDAADVFGILSEGSQVSIRR